MRISLVVIIMIWGYVIEDFIAYTYSSYIHFSAYCSSLVVPSMNHNKVKLSLFCKVKLGLLCKVTPGLLIKVNPGVNLPAYRDMIKVMIYGDFLEEDISMML